MKTSGTATTVGLSSPQPTITSATVEERSGPAAAADNCPRSRIDAEDLRVTAWMYTDDDDTMAIIFNRTGPASYYAVLAIGVRGSGGGSNSGVSAEASSVWSRCETRSLTVLDSSSRACGYASDLGPSEQNDGVLRAIAYQFNESYPYSEPDWDDDPRWTFEAEVDDPLGSAPWPASMPMTLAASWTCDGTCRLLRSPHRRAKG